MRNIMRFSDDDIKDIEKEIKGEVASGEVEDPKEPEPKEEPPQQKDSPNDEGDK